MSTNSHDRRLVALESLLQPFATPEAYELAQRIAAKEGIDAEELIREAHQLMQDAGPPHTVKHLASYAARQEGVIVDVIMREWEAIRQAYGVSPGQHTEGLRP
jgi:hypothetical protein